MSIKAKQIQWLDNFPGVYYDLAYGFSIEYFKHRNYFRAYKNKKIIDVFESIDEAKAKCQQLADEFVNEVAEIINEEQK